MKDLVGKPLGLATLLALVLVLTPGAWAAERYTLRASLYYSALQQDYREGSNAKFLSAKGKTLRTGSREFLKAASIEGSAVFSDGTVLNYDRLVRGEVRWRRVRSRYGIDARGCDLVPFRSVAVDPALIQLGTRLMIPRTVGWELPDGGAHDGIWIATDTGNGIDGRRIDLFTGMGKASMRPVEAAGIDYLTPLEVLIVDQESPCP